MARSTYLGTTNDWLTETTSSGYVKIADDAKTLRFWSAATGGTQHTDLLIDGAAATELVVPANAAFAPAVDGPDGVNDGMWLEVVGVTTRVFVTPSKPLTEAKAYADTQVATRETPAGAQAKADAAVTAAATDATTKANAAEANAKAASIPLTQKGAANGVAALGADGRSTEAQLPAHLAQTSLNAAYGPSAKAVRLAYGPSPLPGAIITNRGAAPVLGTNTHAATNTSRVKYTVRREGGDLRVVFDHYTSGSGGDGDPAAAVTFRCSLERVVSGTTYQFPVTFRGGQVEVTMDRGRIISDPIACDVAVGEALFVRTYVASGTPRATALTVSANGEGLAATDLTGGTAGAVTASNSFVWAPTAILSSTRLADNDAVGIVGDSIAYGQGDTPGDVAGFLVRSADTAGLPWVMAARAQETVGAVWDINYRYRGPLVAGCKRIYCAYGRNDLTNGNATSLIQINLVKFWKRLARRGPVVYQTTITPRTTSTDSWATTGNQTTADATQEGRRVELNTWLRAGAPLDPSTLLAVAVGTAGAVVAGNATHPLTGVIEVTDAVETARDSGIWKAAYTADGLHPNATGHAAMAAAVVM